MVHLLNEISSEIVHSLRCALSCSPPYTAEYGVTTFTFQWFSRFPPTPPSYNALLLTISASPTFPALQPFLRSPPSVSMGGPFFSFNPQPSTSSLPLLPFSPSLFPSPSSVSAACVCSFHQISLKAAKAGQTEKPQTQNCNSIKLKPMMKY